jgi:hypothetical protein
MQDSGSRSVRFAGRYTFIALLLIFSACFQFADAGLDEGSFDLSQPTFPDTVAWAWATDSTSDGDGTEYIAYLGAFRHAGPADPSVSTTASFRPGVLHQDLASFVAWIVASNPHVASSAELTIVKRVVTTITLP